MRLGRRPIAWLAALLVALVPLGLLAQDFGFRSRFGQYPNVPYDGRFTFARIRYAAYGGWRADYPTMEENLTTMLHEITAIRPHVGRSNVHDFDDPDLFRFPLAYLSEPGYWFPSDTEVAGLRDYLHKGGFLIVDDFHFANEWAVFEAAMRRVLPGAKIERLELSHPIFNTFFQIKSLDVPYPGWLGQEGVMGEFYGIHEDNDPDKPLMVVVNYNIDIGDYVEWSGREDVYALVPTNEAYKFAINYVMYALTH